MTYWSRILRISCGVGSLFLSARAVSAVAPSSRMMSLQSSMHSSQMNTDGPAMSFLTSCWLLPQKEQYKSLSPDPLSAIHLPHETPRAGLHHTLQALSPAPQDFIDQAVFQRLVRRQEVVAVGIALDLG